MNQCIFFEFSTIFSPFKADIGIAVIFLKLKSDVKFFFICTLKTAAKRRHKELIKKNSKIKLKDVKKALRIRNISDTKRKNSPLLRHRDSVSIDTGKLNKQEMQTKMSKYVDKLVKKKYGK
mgnify:CR=1 FL=1